MVTRKPKKGVTVKHAAEILAVSVGTLRKWDKEGKLRAMRAKNGYRMYTIGSLEAFAEKEGLARHSLQKVRLIL